MSIKYVFMIIILVLVLVIIGMVFFAVCKVIKKVFEIRSSVRAFSKEFMGSSNIIQGIRNVQNEYATTPKSVAAATSIFLPRISAEFPQFHYEEMKGRAQNVLLSYLAGISNGSAEYLKDGNSELKNSLENRIYAMKSAGKQEYFDEPKIHRTEIAGYTKSAGRCTITFQSSIQYKHYLMDRNGNLLAGSDTTYEQGRYNIDLIYIQDRTIVENDIDGLEGRNCPNCGAPLKSINARNCIYCGTPIVEYNIKVWTFSSVREA